MSDTDWKCDLCGRKQDGGEKPPQGWLLLVIPDRYTNLNEERVLCGYCVEVVRADHLANLDPDKLAERIAKAVILESVRYLHRDMEDHHQECEVRDWYEAKSATYQGVIYAMLAPILARNAAMEAVLRECRPYLKHDRLCVLEKHDAEDFSICKCGLKAIASRIDELTAKGATAP